MSALVRIGTRRSALATTQARTVAAALAARGVEVELVPVVTTGDTTPGPLTQIGGTGVFVSALREALLDGRVDVAVHSLKDLPTAEQAGIALAAVPEREDPRDVLVASGGRTLAELPTGARVGTGSPRRAAQLRALGLDLDVVAIRGNVDSRLRLVEQGEVDAVVLARAGLSRLGLLDRVTEVLDPLQMLPAPGQGALAVECRAEDSAVAALVSPLDDRPSRLAVAAERSLLSALEAGCIAPVGGYAVVAEGPPDAPDESELYLRAAVVAIDGSAGVRLSASGPLDNAVEIGRALAADLLAEGAGTVMRAGEPMPNPQVLPLSQEETVS